MAYIQDDMVYTKDGIAFIRDDIAYVQDGLALIATKGKVHVLRGIRECIAHV